MESDTVTIPRLAGSPDDDSKQLASDVGRSTLR
jgi:hypothetical protein